MLTENEKKIIKELLFSFGEDYSINEVSRKCGLTPTGALKILKKFAKEGIVVFKKIGNMNSYSINFLNPKTKSTLELSLIEEGNDRVKNRFEDLKELQKFTDASIIFGSYISKKETPQDIDILFVLDKNNFRKYKQETEKIYPAMPLKAHDVLQTMEDLEDNIRKKDKALIGILKTGIILWGQDKIIEAIKNGCRK